MAELTPLLEQYQNIKKNHPEEILLFRLGDFYEMFFEDAVKASQTLSITLTKRASGDIKIPMAGFPYHSAENYINRLVKSGLKIAICDQMEEARPGKLVDRQITRIITPGTLIDESILNDLNYNFLASVFISDSVGLAWIDLSTGRFFVEDLKNIRELENEIARIRPSECLIPASQREKAIVNNLKVTEIEDYLFDSKSLTDHFGVIGLEGFGCKNLKSSIHAAGAIISYLKNTSRLALNHVTKISQYVKSDYMIVDSNALRSLEIINPSREGQKENTLFFVLNKTGTRMGSRLLEQWLLSPLNRMDLIEKRQQGVSELVTNSGVRKNLKIVFNGIQDLERLASKIGTLRANPRDLIALRESLRPLSNVKSIISGLTSPVFKELSFQIDPMNDLIKKLDESIRDDAPVVIGEGNIIKQGFNPELDQVRQIKDNSTKFLAELESREQKRSGINNLRIGYNNVFGYYIEVTNSAKNRVPQDYSRRQTLKNLERYVTTELKEYETKILNAQSRSNQLEQTVFEEIRKHCLVELVKIQRNSNALAVIDVLTSFADVAVQKNYTRPNLVIEPILKLTDSRHPVLENGIKDFVPNNVQMNEGEIFIITGPNMAGKSTFIRQVALTCFMAQIGSFVPARNATIGLVDRIFTRIGSSDDISQGLSTFMIEMNETANILNNATHHSLLILDEIGRGTSTFDGVSIAWAVVEYINNNFAARTLFATHFHELTELSDTLKRVRNFHAEIKEYNKNIVFVYKILEEASDKSYGIHVAALAGIPREVVDKAKLVLAGLEKLTRNQKHEITQIGLFQSTSANNNPLLEELKKVNINSLTPLEAMNKLAELIKKANE